MDPSNSAPFKTDAALKILTPWWDFVFKLITVSMMAIASISLAMQASKDGLACVAAVRCSVVNTSSLVNSCKSAPLDKHHHSNVSILTSFNKDVQMTNFLNSECFHSLDKPYSGFVAVILFGESLVLLAICSIWTSMNPKSSLTLNQFVSLVTECYESVGTDSQITSVLTPATNDVQPPLQSATRNNEQEGIELLPTDSNAPEETTPLSEDSKSKIKTIHNKVEKFSKMQIKRKSLIRVYMVQLGLQTFFSSGFLALLIIHFVCFKPFRSLFKCTLSLESTEMLSVTYDYIRCSRNAQIVSVFNVVTWVFVVLIGFYVVITIVVGFIVWHHLRKYDKLRIQQVADVVHNVDIKGDLSLLCFLLQQHNELQYNRFILFYSEGQINQNE